MKIIGSYVSPYVRKVLACLALKGLDDYEIDPITPFFGGEEFDRLSPLRRIPVLVHGDLVLCNSTVICAWLDEAFPGHPLLPADPADRARARWLEEYADTRLGDVFIWGLFYQKIVHPDRLGRAGRSGADREDAGRGRARRARLSRRPAAGGRLAVRRDRPRRHRHRQLLPQRAPMPASRSTPARWPLTAAFVERALAHPCFEATYPFEKAQMSTNPQGRRQALLDAGAPLVAESVGTREPRKGIMTL